MHFRYIHLYPDDAADARIVASEIAKVFPQCKVDVRKPFFDRRQPAAIIEQAKISDVKQPFEKQPRIQEDSMAPLYDGFVLQRLLAPAISDRESGVEHLHLVFTDVLTCTFDEDDDWRYHGRAVVCGTPSIISTAGIVEAPAKPREFYLAQLGGFADIANLKKKFAGRFIDYGDDAKMAAAAAAYALQAIFFFVSDGEPFCEDRACRLFNAHWQEDLVRMLEKPALCSRHQEMANKFNRQLGSS